MKLKLRDYQKRAFVYTMDKRHPALFIEMRLGKTLIVIRRCLLYKPLDGKKLRILVVGPSSCLGSWMDQLKAEGESDVALLVGSAADRRDLLASGAKWCLINKEGFLAIPEMAWTVNWDCVILDESTFIKNPKAKVTRYFLKHFRDCPHRWILTGTPNPESDLEFWPQLAFLDGGAFGHRNFWNFRSADFQPDSRGFKWMPKPGVQQKINRAVAGRAFILRRKDVALATTKIKEVRWLELPKALRSTYSKVEADFELEGNQTLWAMVKYSWLQRMVGGFIDDRLVYHGKVDCLLELLTGELSQEQVVVWFNYNSEIRACSDALHKAKVTHRILWGAQDLPERLKIRQTFVDGSARILLVQQAVAQMGMDLSVSDTAIYYSMTPSFLAMSQTADRIVRVGKTSPLLYIYLVVKDSVDEDLYHAIVGKTLRAGMSLDAILKTSLAGRLG